MKFLHLISLLLSLLILSACSANYKYQLRTGFLDTYEGLEKVSTDKIHYFKTMDDANLSAYDKIYIPDIKVLSNTPETSPRENKLYTLISEYTSAAYRKNIMKNSANYSMVGVAQEGTIIMQIAISTVEVHPKNKEWDNLSALAFTLNESTQQQYKEGNVRLLIEARITDAMNQKLLAHSMRVIMDEEIHTNKEYLSFSNVQASLDKWLYKAIIKH